MYLPRPFIYTFCGHQHTEVGSSRNKTDAYVSVKDMYDAVKEDARVKSLGVDSVLALKL